MSGDSFMTVPTDPSVVRRLRTASFAGSVACVIVGIVVLLGWLLDVPFLKSIHASFASMKPNTALGFVLIGSTLWLRRGEEGRTRASRLAHVLAAVVTLLGMLTFFEYASGWNLGIDELLFKEVLVASPAMPPGRMSPITAVMFTLMGSALLLLDVRLGESRRCPFQWLALLSALCALLSVLGYVYGVRGLYKIGPFTSIALHTAFAFLVGSGAVLLARPEDGLIRFVASDSPAGVMARRLLPAAILIPATLGWLRLKGQQAGYYDTEFGLALFAASNIVGFTALVWWNSGALSRADEERRRAEAAVRESEARKMAVMEAALDAIVLMDHEGKITDFNAAAERTFGYSHAEVVGKALAALLIPPALRDRHRAGLTRYLETGETHVLGRRIEVPALRKDGTSFPAELTVVRIRSEGPPFFTGYIRDITERQRAAEAEMLRREKEATEEANRELESFSYSVAHDLRAPLRGMSGFSAILRNDYGDKLDAEGREYLDRIVASAARMSQIIDALLSLARLTRTEIRRERVDLTRMAQSVVEQFRASEPERVVDFVAEDGLEARGDPQLLRVLLESLLGNAWKFTRKRSVARIELGREVVGNGTAYFVRDNGAGFDMALADRLFAPFQRLHATSDFEGTGIGLATVQRIIRRHRGRIWAEGTENAGAVFRFTVSE